MSSRSNSRPARNPLAAVALVGLGAAWLLGGLYLVCFFSLHGLPADAASRVQTPQQAVAASLLLLNVALLALVAPGTLLVLAGLRLRPR
jgi:uncharacterized membrane protein